MLKITKSIICIIALAGLLNPLDAQNHTEYISKKQAEEELQQFERILKKESSYFGRIPFDLEKELALIRTEMKDSISIAAWGRHLEKIMGEIGDRHSGITYSSPVDRIERYTPFAIAVLNDQLVALRENEDQTYSAYSAGYPFISAIDDLPAEEWIERVSIRHKHAPRAAKLYYAARSLSRIGEEYYRLYGKAPREIKVSLANEKGEKKELNLPLDKVESNPWKSLTATRDWVEQLESQPQALADLFERKEGNIGYIRIPRMWGKEAFPEYFEYLHANMKAFANTSTLILDVRDNPGGRRDILMELAGYFLNPEGEPWLANIAKIRIDQDLNEDIESMTARYLYSMNSKYFEKEDRAVIEGFMKDFEPKWQFDAQRFSDNFYMVFNHNRQKAPYYYDQPVYVLANERSFSAASVFVAALKGFGKVKIAGVNTDGSSGRSVREVLRNSGITVRYSTMISLQRNGKTLDTNGTEPDLYLPEDWEQITGTRDTQLNTLLRIAQQQK